MFTIRQSPRLGALVVAALTWASCDSSSPTDNTGRSILADVIPTTSTVENRKFKVCKVGTAADFTFTANGGPVTPFHLNAGECVIVHQFGGSPPQPVSVTEVATTGIELDSILRTRKIGATITTTKLTGTNTVSGQVEIEEGFVVTFFNTVTETQNGGDDGCTPGFWKNHLSLWPVSSGLDFDATFGVDLFSPNITLLTAINLGGGGANKLARHAVAAYLTSLASGVDPALTTAEVIAAVQAGDAETLVAANESGCPLN